MERGLGRALVLVVLAAAVALGAFLVVRPAEAAEVTLDATTGTVNAEPGDTVLLPRAADIVRFTIDTANNTSTGSFASGGGQTIACSDDGTCDVDDDGSGNNVADSVTVKLNVDAGSSDGFIIVKWADVIAADGSVGTASGSYVINVKTQPKPASLTVAAASTTIDANGAIASVGDAGRTQIVATVKNNQSPSVGMNAQRLTFVTNLGVMDCPASGSGATAINAATNVQWCQVWTTGQDNPLTDATETSGDAGFDGHAVIDLKQSGREGTATVTVSHDTLNAESVDITLFGTAKNVAAAPEQNSVEVGGKVFIVLTVTDGAGNPVKNVQPQPAAEDPIVGPDGEDVNAVSTTQAADDANADTSPYNVNKDGMTIGTIDKGDIPACGPVAAVTANPDATPPVVGVFASTGTNDAGQCVVQVHAQGDDAATANTDESATRGVHTLNFALGDLTASAMITVAGPAHSIATDPATGSTIEPLSDNTITITVTDDEGVLVGATAVDVVQVAGDGLTEGLAPVGGDDTPAMTSNGEASFHYTAGLGGSQVVFRIRAGSGDGRITDVLTLNVGAPEDAGPTVIELTDGPDSTYVAWSDDWGTVSSSTFENVPGLVVVWKWTGIMWIGYTSSPTAPDATKTNFNVGPGDVIYVVSNGAVTITIH